MPRTIDRLLCAIAAILFAALGGVFLWRMFGHSAGYLRAPAILAIVVAAAFGIAAARPSGRYQRLMRNAALLLLNTAVIFGLAEAAFRIARVDFNELLGVRAKNEAFPLYFRMPTRQIGEVFFTREGPAEWTGKPLTTLLKLHQSTDSDYTAEPEVTILYDKDGFRNPSDLEDWDIAIAGDSFTESGYLPDAEIFTGKLAALSGLKVKNLGVTDTGNFSHTHYLKDYGKAPSCRHAVLAFFEGNDLDDNVSELNDLRKFKETGARPSHDIEPERSLLRTLYRFIRDIKKIKLGPRSYANATFKTTDGSVIPLTIADAPPSIREMTPEQIEALDLALTRWAEQCREHNLTAHLLYIPCKRRVLHDLMEKLPSYPQPGWQPGNLPSLLKSESEKLGIRFIDSTPPLIEKSRAGILTFNAIYDTHLNAMGHQVVAETLAQALGAAASSRPRSTR